MEIFHILDLNAGIDIDSLIIHFNTVQSSFLLKRYPKDETNISEKELELQYIFDSLENKRRSPKDRIIGITSASLQNNFFSGVNKNYDIAIISIDQSELYTPHFKVQDYLQAEILISLLLMLTQMNIGHYDTRGCLFDFCEDKRDIAIKLYSGSICADCKARLVYYGIDDADIISAQKLLWQISRDFHSAKVNHGCPLGSKICQEFKSIQKDFSDANIFFATSFRDDFLDMADHLKSKLNEIGFNMRVVNEEISNKSMLCKICKTMQTCKYGIAEFSGFRHNVSYEFGLMQAFGLQSIAVVKSDKFDQFEKEISDMKGIEVIPYSSISKDLFDKIKKFIGYEM